MPLLVALLTASATAGARAQSPDVVSARPPLDYARPALSAVQGPPLRAVEGAGILAGIVVDDTDAVLPDVVIAAMNTATGVCRQAMSGGDGSFAIPLLPAGTYVVTADRAGFAPLEVRNVALARDQYLVLRIRLRLGGVQESVEVTAEAPGGDVSQILLPAAARAASGIRVSGDLQQQLPLLAGSPNFSDVLLLTPGRTGLAFDAVALLDGADVTSNRQAESTLLHMGPEAIAHVEVRTAGMDASMPLAQGAVMKVTTRSGTNEIRGQAGVLSNARGWVANNEPGGSSPRGDAVRGSVAAGGPLRRDRAWVFGAYARDESHAAASHTAADIAVLKALVPGWAPYDLADRAEDRYAKVTIRPSPAHEVSAFYQANTQSMLGPGGPTEAPFTRATIGGTAFGAAWNSVWSDTFLGRVFASFNDKTVNQTSDYRDRTALVLHQGVYPAGIVLTGTGAIALLNAMPGCCMDEPSSKLSIGGEGTWYRSHLFGTHEVEFGFLLQPRLRVAGIQRFNNAGLDYEEAVLRAADNPAAGFQTFHRVIYDAPESSRQDSHGTDNAIFVQDAWRPASRLTLAAGLRADHLTDFDVLADWEVRSAWAIGPRASATWEVTPASALRVSWGRIHESAAAGRYVTASIGNVGRRDLFDADLDGVFETELYVSPRAVVGPPGVDVERRQAHVDELTAGYRVRLPGRIALDAGLVRRAFHALPFYDPGYIYQDGVVTGFRPGTSPGRGTVTADIWSVPVITDLTLQATRLTGPVLVIGSYTRSFRHIAGTWVPSDPASVLQPEAFEDDKGIGSTSWGTADSLRADATANQLSVDHSVRATVVCQLPRRLDAAVHYQVSSGPWSGPIVTVIPAADPKHGPPAMAIDRSVVTNPLATTLRFAYPTRGTGQVQLPAVHTLNLRIGARVPAGRGRIDLALDVFNPFNLGRFVAFKPNANDLASSEFGQGGTRQRPRMLQASARFSF